MAELLKKIEMNKRSAKFLADLFEGSCGELVHNQLKNIGKKKQGLRYDEVIRSFALSIHYHSARAYEQFDTSKLKYIIAIRINIVIIYFNLEVSN
jgi:hypothetical protein